VLARVERAKVRHERAEVFGADQAIERRHLPSLALEDGLGKLLVGAHRVERGVTKVARTHTTDRCLAAAAVAAMAPCTERTEELGAAGVNLSVRLHRGRL
jgi:hypothetical protein